MTDLGGLRRLLQGALVVTFVAALGGAFVPGSVGRVSEWVCLVALIGAPVVRVAWLTVAWLREGDRRFAVVGGALLAVLVTSFVISRF